eukprot:s11694_g2.t1
MFCSLLASCQLLMPGFIAGLDFLQIRWNHRLYYPQTTISELLRCIQTFIVKSAPVPRLASRPCAKDQALSFEFSSACTWFLLSITLASGVRYLARGAKTGAFQLHDQGGLRVSVGHRTAAALARFSTMKLFKPSTPEQQIESLRSQKCEVECTAEHVQPKAGCKVVDPCRVEGPQETQKVAQKIIECKTPTPTEVINYFNGELKKRICFLDGGMGTRIQAESLEEADYRGDRFKDFSEKDANGIPV